MWALRPRLRGPQHVEEFAHAPLRIGVHLTASPPQSVDLAGREPPIAVGVPSALLLRLVVLVAVELDRDDFAPVEDEEVHSVASIRSLYPRLDSKDESGLTESLVERDLE